MNEDQSTARVRARLRAHGRARCHTVVLSRGGGTKKPPASLPPYEYVQICIGGAPLCSHTVALNSCRLRQPAHSEGLQLRLKL